jgi:fatty acid desaturase
MMNHPAMRSILAACILNMVLTGPSLTVVTSFTLSSSGLSHSLTSNVNQRCLSLPSKTKLNTIALEMETATLPSLITQPKNSDDDEVQPDSAMMMDLSGIAFSGLKGQALSMSTFPKASEIRAVIPSDCFESDTMKSLSCLAISTVGTAICTAIGIAMMTVLNPSNPLTWPIWSLYSAVTGTVAMGLWVLAHECGHGAFSKNKVLQDTVGYVIHSIMLVPYYSWQRSHAVHHQYTNHMELGETHVPEASGDSLQRRASLLRIFGKERGIQVWGALQTFLHLVVGWPAYLLIGATGGPARGMTNHFYPEPLSTPEQRKKELFPGNWKTKVYQSDIGIAATVAAVVAWTICNGPAQVMALYGGPLIIVNAWLVLYTWLQHTDTDVPHFSADDHTFVKGALHTIDRPYDKLDAYGIIDFLHHKIGTTHVAHHFDSTIPHYKAQIATDAIKASFPEYYLYDPTPIPQALWRIAKGCTSVEQRGDRWVWNNAGVEDQIECK